MTFDGSATNLTALVGTEVTGIQLSKLDSRAVEDLALLVAHRGVVVFRDQVMTLEQQIHIASRFGDLHVHPVWGTGPNPAALRIHVDASSEYAAGDDWHTDVSWDIRPPALSFLQLDEGPNVGGDTLFLSTAAALVALSPPIKKLLAPLRAQHGYRGGATAARFTRSHPVVRRHPLTGDECLYVNRAFTERLQGLSDRESDGLLALLFSHLAEGAEFQCRVRWAPGTVVVWDNRCTQHRAIWDYFPETRSGWRVSTVGEMPQ